MLRRFRRLLLALAALSVALITVLVVIATVYEDEVKAKLIGALNERLLAPVQVGDIDLTLIARFPNASMRLRDVKAEEVRTDGQPPDTLLAARELFLEFNLWDLFDGDYTVQRIHGIDVRLYPGLDRNGAENFRIWRSDSNATKASPVALEALSVENLVLRYRDEQSGLLVTAVSEKTRLGGRFGETSELRLDGDMRLLGIERAGKELLGPRSMHLALKMAFDDGAFRITEGEVQLGKVPLQVTLAVLTSSEGRRIDLRTNGLGLDLTRTVEQLPPAIRGPLTRFGLAGEVDLAVKYVGSLEGDGPPISIGAMVTNARMKERKSGTALTGIFGELALEVRPDGTVSKLKVKDLRASSGSGSLRADWSSGGLKNAPVKADIRCDIAIVDLLRLAGVDTLEQAAGRFAADITVNGTLRDMSDLRPSDFRLVKVDGHVSLSDATVKVKGIRHRVEHLNAELSLHGNDATVRGLKAEVQGSPIELSGTLRNLVPFVLFPNERLVIEAKGRSERLDLAALLQSDSRQAAASEYTLVLPATVELDLRAQVDELVFEDFRATGINGTIRLADRMLRVSPITFSTADGAVLGSLELDARGGRSAAYYPLAIDAQVKDVDVKQLFREFQDFGQAFIGHRHLSGKARAGIAFRAPLSPTMKLDRDRMTCTIDIAVDNGGIKDHAQLLAIADHLKKNKLVSPFVDTDELRRRMADVRFAKLENRVEIRDGAVHVPLMEVRSNAFDIEMAGTHWFDDRIDHHLNFRLSDLFRLGRPTGDEFGPIADDGTGMRVFLHMYGTASSPQFGNDGAMAANRRRQQFQQERQQLRAILREDILGKKPEGELAQKQPESTPGRIVIEPDSAAGLTRHDLVHEKPRKGLGRLLKDDKDKDEGGKVTVED
ncbi:MAG: hypothetical protein IPM46_08590 [Flavobacteriales bacterium]|nr:hypothetical protein [Flavobacteriales bacterium]